MSAKDQAHFYSIAYGSLMEVIAQLDVACDLDYITKEEFKQFLVVLNPLAPHITSELYEQVFGADILDATFPEYDESKLEKDEVTIPVQINGKVRGTITIAKNATREDVENACYNDGRVEKDLVKKVIFVPGKIINFIV